MDLDPLLLSRIQFGFVVAFHILFPAFTIGLASYIALLEALWFATKRPVYLQISQFWIPIFAISFGMGVVSGIVMAYQFGTNWSRFSDATANVIGPLLSYEVLTAFFLEATFLGILLFGRKLVPPALIVLSAAMIALGTLVSAFWILSANSWMNTPAGFEVRDGLFHVTDWAAAIFNPSFPYRLAHMVVACYITTAFVVIGVSGWFLLKRRALGPARLMFSMTLWLVTVLVPLQIVLGDLHGLNTFLHQPVKVAAMEGHWETQRGAPMILFALPDPEAETNRLQVGIPKLGSLILQHDLDAEVRGLKEWAPEERPPVPVVFWSFRVMVAIGFALLAIVIWSLVLRARRRLFDGGAFHRVCVVAAPAGFVAVIAGWITTEVGRQPWVVYEVMRTADGLSPTITGPAVLGSLTAYILSYAAIFGAGTYFIFAQIRKGPAVSPDAEDVAQEPPPEGVPAGRGTTHAGE